MAAPESIRETYKRNAEAIALQPSVGKSTGQTTVYLRDGTTCEVQNGPWSFTTDIGTEQGGNDEGPGPGVLEAAFDAGAVALAYRRFDKETRISAHADYLDTIAPYKNGTGYDIPGEFVVVGGVRPES